MTSGKSKKADSPFAKLEALRSVLPESAKAKADANKAKLEADKARTALKAALKEPETLSFAELMGQARAVPVRDVPAQDVVPERSVASIALDALTGPRFILHRGPNGKTEGRRVDEAPALLALQKGRFPIDARLDIHGLTRETAEPAVLLFIEAARQRRERAVLIIHGKGLGSHAGVSILRAALVPWLTEGRSARAVLAFTEATAKEGGEGATLVLLALLK
jgi:DNA-nicking Smr family endonuclease